MPELTASETTARDRAIEAEQVAISLVERLLFTEGCEESLRHARTIVRALLVRREVLRALAAAPDGTALLARCDEIDRTWLNRKKWPSIPTHEVRALLAAPGATADRAAIERVPSACLECSGGPEADGHTYWCSRPALDGDTTEEER